MISCSFPYVSIFIIFFLREVSEEAESADQYERVWTFSLLYNPQFVIFIPRKIGIYLRKLLICQPICKGCNSDDTSRQNNFILKDL